MSTCINRRVIIFSYFQVSKGDVLSTARLAGIMAAKQTSNLIPLCHNINITSIDIDCKLCNNHELPPSYQELAYYDDTESNGSIVKKSGSEFTIKSEFK